MFGASAKTSHAASTQSKNVYQTNRRLPRLNNRRRANRHRGRAGPCDMATPIPRANVHELLRRPLDDRPLVRLDQRS